MKHGHPIFSVTSLSLSFLLLAGLGLTIWRNGESIFSPGRLSGRSLEGIQLGNYSSHAEFEEQCSLCHEPLEVDQDTLCVKCHEDVQNQIEQADGIHGNIKDRPECATCHPDHRGRTYDPGTAALGRYDHTWTNFSLGRHGLSYDLKPIACLDCHTKEVKFIVSPGKCAMCHTAHDPAFMAQHNQDFGDSCLGCHDGLDRFSEFDHSTLAFPLEGQHTGISCSDCHANPNGSSGDLTFASFTNAPTACSECHSLPDNHPGSMEFNCQDCHSPEAWSPAFWNSAPFEHTTDTGFSLRRHSQNFNGSAITCQDCHTEALDSFTVQTCQDCHAINDPAGGSFISEHIAQFGSSCLDCHDGADRMSNYDHNTFYPLEGVHAEVACTDCHQDKVYRGTPRQCFACHAEPEIHAGFFGLECQDCHTPAAWSPAQLRMHGFPLDHGEQGTVPCQTCHTETYTQYTCYGCHEHQPAEMLEKHQEEGISASELPACAECHPDGREGD